MTVWLSRSLGQNLSRVAISGHLERFSPGQNGFEGGHQITLSSLAGHPSLEPFWPAENHLKNDPKIVKALRFVTKIFKKDGARQSRNFREAQRAPKSMAMNHLKTEIKPKTLYKWPLRPGGTLRRYPSRHPEAVKNKFGQNFAMKEVQLFKKRNEEQTIIRPDSNEWNLFKLSVNGELIFAERLCLLFPGKGFMWGNIQYACM